MKTVLAVFFASFYGLGIRLLFGFMDNLVSIMSLTFLGLVPVVIGFVTVILMPKNTSAVAAFFMPWFTSFVILIITIALSIEGSICWLMIYPFFAIAASIGGLIAHWIHRRRLKNENPGRNNFGKPNALNMSLLLFVPALVGYVEGERTLRPVEYTVAREVSIPATPQEVWQQLTNTTVLHDEKRASFSSLIGFPHHLKTVTDTFAVGGRRLAVYEKGLYFKETISRYEINRLLKLTIKTDPEKIPPTVMDEHILIGGKYLEILEDVYKLEPLPDGSCRVELSGRFRINTPFNWYAGLWAHYLMADILQEELDLLKLQATKQ